MAKNGRIFGPDREAAYRVRGVVVRRKNSVTYRIAIQSRRSRCRHTCDVSTELSITERLQNFDMERRKGIFDEAEPPDFIF